VPAKPEEMEVRSCSESAICLARASAASRSRSQASAASRRRACPATNSARAATRAVARAESGRAALSDGGGGAGKELVLVPAPTILLVGVHGGMPKGKGGATAPTTRLSVAPEVGSTTVSVFAASTASEPLAPTRGWPSAPALGCRGGSPAVGCRGVPPVPGGCAVMRRGAAQGGGRWGAP
jgi:hypothetical protein